MTALEHLSLEGILGPLLQHQLVQIRAITRDLLLALLYDLEDL